MGSVSPSISKSMSYQILIKIPSSTHDRLHRAGPAGFGWAVVDVGHPLDRGHDWVNRSKRTTKLRSTGNELRYDDLIDNRPTNHL
jgi:hypothetical protein